MHGKADEREPAPPAAAQEEPIAVETIAELVKRLQTTGTGQATRRKVAILAIHGVGYHQAGQSAAMVKDVMLAPLLQSPLDPENAGLEYGSFRENVIHVPLQAARRQRMPAAQLQREKKGAEKLADAFGFRQEPSAKFAKQIKTQAGPGQPDTGNQYTELLLQQYQGGAAGNEYRCIRLEGEQRRAGQATEIHIYDGRWADLAQKSNQLMRAIRSMFQLTVHLAGLSEEAVHSAGALFSKHGAGWWRALAFCQRWSVRILQLPMLLINFIIAITLLTSVAEAPQGALRAIIALTLLALFLAAGFYMAIAPRRKVLLAKLNRRYLAVNWLLPAAMTGSLGLVIAWARLDWQWVLALELWAAGGVLMLLAAHWYHTVRRGALQHALWLYGAASALFLGESLRQQKLQPTLLQCVRWEMAAAMLFLTLAGAFAFAAAVCGRGLVFTVRNQPKAQAQAKATVRTARMALSVSALLMLIFLSAGWTAAIKLGARAHLPAITSAGSGKAENVSPPALQAITKKPLPPKTNWLQRWFDPYAAASRFGNFAAWLQQGGLKWSFLTGPGWRLVLLALLAALAGLWLLPSILSERRGLRGQNQNPPRSLDDQLSRRMGRWVSAGLNDAGWAIGLVWLAAFAVPAVTLLCRVWHPNLLCRHWQPGSYWFGAVETLVVLLFTYALKTMGAILDAALDVDRYLRTTPVQCTTRAKIYERMTSLLRQIACPQAGYDELIIVAHSLGSVIITDLLRYLKNAPEPELQRLFPQSVNPAPAARPALTVTLVTLGCPLRQLMNRFFPALYGWVRPSPDWLLRPAPPKAKPAFSASPNTREIEAGIWINVYRSGDYIGRNLWTDEQFGLQAICSQRNPGCVDVCIGAGGHVHYWDDSAPAVGQILNALTNSGK